MEQGNREGPVYRADEIAGILNQLVRQKTRATIELRHDGSGRDGFSFYFTKINAADVTLRG